jgi:hypothetical protein
LACENTILTHVGRFSEKATQEQAAKTAKTHSGSTSFKSTEPKPPTVGSPRPPSAKKGAYGASASNQQPTDQPTGGKKKEADGKEVPVDLSNQDKKVRLNTNLEAK